MMLLFLLSIFFNLLYFLDNQWVVGCSKCYGLEPFLQRLEKYEEGGDDKDKTKAMTLRELIHSVDSEQYSYSALYQRLRETKPEYGSNRHIQVKLVSGEVTVTNVHVGSLGDIITYPIDVDPELNI